MDFDQLEMMVATLKEAPHVTELELRSGDTVLRLRRPPPQRHKKADKPAAGASDGKTPAPKTAPPAAGPKPTLVTASLVGVFRGSTPAAVAPGDVVKAGQTLGHLEAMRLINDIPAPAAGRVQAVFVQEAQPVEYGQPLFEIVPE